MNGILGPEGASEMVSLPGAVPCCALGNHRSMWLEAKPSERLGILVRKSSEEDSEAATPGWHLDGSAGGRQEKSPASH